MKSKPRFPSSLVLACVLAIPGTAVSPPAAGQDGIDRSALVDYLDCLQDGSDARDCAIRSGYMDGDTFDRVGDMQACIAAGGERNACRIESGLATEESISNQLAAEQDLVDYVALLTQRAVAQGDPVQRLSALELVAALQRRHGTMQARLDPDRARALTQALASGLEAELGQNPALLTGLMRACQELPCADRGLVERIEDLEPGNLYWLDRHGHPLREDATAWLEAAAAADSFNERQWDTPRRVTRLMQAHPPPQSLLADSEAGTGFPPELLAFSVAFMLTGDLDVVEIRLGGGPLARACTDQLEDHARQCFAIGELMFAHGGTLGRRQEGAGMMQASAWDDQTRWQAEHAERVVAWQQQRQHQASSGANAAPTYIDELGFARDAMMQEGAAEVDMLQAYFARAGIPLEPPAQGSQ